MLRAALAVFLLFSCAFSGAAFALEKEYEIAVTNGALEIDQGHYLEAIDLLTQAIQLKPSDPHATLLLGIAYSRAGKPAEAELALSESLRLAPETPRALFELGVLYYHRNELQEAEGYFQQVIENAPQKELVIAASKYLEVITFRGFTEKKPYSLGFIAGLEYDSNVILEPDDPLVGGRQEENWRGLFNLDGHLFFLDTEQLAGKIGYSFYQSVHDTLTDFNVQQHKATLVGEWRPGKQLQAALKYHFAHTRVGEDHELYGNTHLVGPTATWLHTPNWATEFYYAHEFRRFFNTDIFSFNTQRSGDKDTVGISEKFKIAKVTGLSIGYVFDYVSADEKFWGYRGHKGVLKLGSSFGRLHLFLAASYHDRNYQDEFPGFGRERHDQMQEYSATLMWIPTQRMSIRLSELFINNNSNISDADYHRNIAGLHFEVRL